MFKMDIKNHLTDNLNEWVIRKLEKNDDDKWTSLMEKMNVSIACFVNETWPMHQQTSKTKGNLEQKGERKLN